MFCAEARETLVRSSGRDLVSVKASVIDDDLAKLGLKFMTENKTKQRLVQREAYRAGEVAGRKFEARNALR